MKDYISLVEYLFTRKNGTMFLFEDICSNRAMYRYDTLVDKYVIFCYRGLFTKFSSTLLNCKKEILGFYSSNSDFTLMQFVLHCTNHLSDYRLIY